MSEDRIPPDSEKTTMKLLQNITEREERLKEKEDKMCEGKRPIIDSSTLLPIGMVVTIAGMVWFAASLSTKVYANEGRVDKLEQAIITINDVQVQISALSAKLDLMQKNLDKDK